MYLKNNYKMSNLKYYLVIFFKRINEKFTSHFGFNIKGVTFCKIVAFLHSPRDPSSLAVTRIFFGLCMLFDIPDERGGAIMQKRWGDPTICHFPLLPFITAVPMPYMALVYACLWFGALGIMLGYKYRLSATVFAVCYWYLFLIEMSFWNNHSYLFGLVALLLIGTDADCYWSLDAHKNPSKRRETVPYWNYFVLKYQFFILYFVAGLKKGTAEWLTGYSLQHLAEHWVFDPFKIFLTVAQIDYLIVHWFAFLFDLTIAFWMMWGRSRNVAMLFCVAFHLMNIRLFRIGMFPWVCLATLPLFYPFDWPKRLLKCVGGFTIRRNETPIKEALNESANICDKIKSKNKEPNQVGDIGEKKHLNATLKQKLITCAILLYMALQAFLPYSHFLTKGYNNWTNGLYGYSWDMMVHSWVPHSAIVKIVDNDYKRDLYLDPSKLTPNERWITHGNMIFQFSQCIKSQFDNAKTTNKPINISIYFEIWCSMNRRFQQRMFDSNVDLLKADWHPLEKISWLMPLLDDTTQWRRRSVEIEKDVFNWNNQTNVIFIADFPGYSKTHFLETDMLNITLTVLEGKVVYEPDETSSLAGQSFLLLKGEHIRVPSGVFHAITTFPDEPAFYMYTYLKEPESIKLKNNNNKSKPMLQLQKEFIRRFKNIVTFLIITVKSLAKLLIHF